MRQEILAIMPIVYITFGCLCAHIHSSKGYSGLVGFIAGTLLPLPAILIALLEKENPKRKVINQDIPSSEEDIET